MSNLHIDQHTSNQYNVELEEIKSRLLDMGGVVEKQITEAIAALEQGDSSQARLVRDRDREVNQMEVDIDEECARILARRQPAASDLRLVIGVTKINTDLERIGDEAKRIANLAIQLSEKGSSPRGYVEVRHIGERASTMVRNALDAFARFDMDMAIKVAYEDKSVDLEYKTALRELITYMMEDPRSITRVIDVIWALRSLERVGDHARNIAEHVIYMVKGRDVRHVSFEEMEAEANSK